MACEYDRRRGQNEAKRREEVKAALKRLELALRTGAVAVKVGPQGAVAFVGWADTQAGRDGVSDVCAYRELTRQGSWELRQAVMKAEAQSGYKVNPVAVGAGVHSHDGGGTWHKGH